MARQAEVESRTCTLHERRAAWEQHALDALDRAAALSATAETKRLAATVASDLKRQRLAFDFDILEIGGSIDRFEADVLPARFILPGPALAWWSTI